MNTTVEALKSLYVDLGGSAADVADVTVIPDMIEAVAEVAKGGKAAEPFDVNANEGIADKSLGEIQEACEAGKQIRFNVDLGNGSIMCLNPVMFTYNNGYLTTVECVSVTDLGELGGYLLTELYMSGQSSSKVVTANNFTLSKKALG